MRKENTPSGILGFPVAPFDKQDRLDEKAFQQNVKFLLEGGLDSIFVGAGSGEYQSLNPKEYEAMLEITVSEVNGKVPVYSGVGGDLDRAINLAKLSEKKGMDGFLILPPYLIYGEQEGYIDFYTRVVESTSLDGIIYQRNNAIFTLDTVKKLADHPQIVGLKDGHGDMQLNIEYTKTLGDKLTWMNGMPFGEVTFPAYYSIGYDSYSSAISNYIPHISRMFFNALKENNQDLIDDLYNDVIFPINNIRKLKKGYAVSLLKAGMEIVGLPVGETVRPPLVPVDKDHFKQLENVLEKVLEKYPAPTKSSVV